MTDGALTPPDSASLEAWIYQLLRLTGACATAGTPARSPLGEEAEPA
jgi:hypothetical protein